MVRTKSKPIKNAWQHKNKKKKKKRKVHKLLGSELAHGFHEEEEMEMPLSYATTYAAGGVWWKKPKGGKPTVHTIVYDDKGNQISDLPELEPAHFPDREGTEEWQQATIAAIQEENALLNAMSNEQLVMYKDRFPDEVAPDDTDKKPPSTTTTTLNVHTTTTNYYADGTSSTTTNEDIDTNKKPKEKPKTNTANPLTVVTDSNGNTAQSDDFGNLVKPSKQPKSGLDDNETATNRSGLID